MVAYQWHLLRAGRLVAFYGFPTWLAGTVSLNIGASVCAYVVVGSTREARDPVPEGSQFFRFQRALDEQSLPAYLIRSPPGIRQTKWRSTTLKERPWAISLGAFLSLGGFVCQNIGTRELHFSAGLLQLAANLILTLIRALLRRHIEAEVDPTPIAIRDSPACKVLIEMGRKLCRSPYLLTKVFVDDAEIACSRALSVYEGQLDLISPGTPANDLEIRCVEALLRDWGTLAHLEDDKDLQRIKDIVEKLYTTMSWLLSHAAGEDHNLGSGSPYLEWDHHMYLEESENFEWESIQRQNLQIVPCYFSKLEDTRNFMKAILRFSCYNYTEKWRTWHDERWQIVGTSEEGNINDVVHLQDKIDGKLVSMVLNRPASHEQPLVDLVHRADIRGLRFSGHSSKRYPDFNTIFTEDLCSPAVLTMYSMGVVLSYTTEITNRRIR